MSRRPSHFAWPKSTSFDCSGCDRQVEPDADATHGWRHVTAEVTPAEPARTPDGTTEALAIYQTEGR